MTRRTNNLSDFWEKVEKKGPKECWLWKGGRNPQGYGTWSYRGITWRAHKMAYRLTKGNVPKGYQVRHSCDNPPCCNPFHLLRGTRKQNAQDAIRRNRLNPKRGEAHWASIFTESDVRKVHSLYATGKWTQRELADLFGSCHQSIGFILRGEHWAHLKPSNIAKPLGKLAKSPPKRSKLVFRK